MPDRSTVISRLATALAAQPLGDPLGRRLCGASMQVLGVDGVALTLDGLTRGRTTVCSTDADAAAIEDLHEVLGEGPGVDALLGEPVAVDLDAAADVRWPAFAPAVRARTTARSVLALPLRPRGEPLGVLVAYRRSEGVLRMSVAEAVFLSTTVGAALLADIVGAPGHAVQSWPDRASVHQATGMVMAQLRVEADDALAILRAHAFADDRRLVEVADDVVARTLAFGVPSVTAAVDVWDDGLDGLDDDDGLDGLDGGDGLDGSDEGDEDDGPSAEEGWFR